MCHPLLYHPFQCTCSSKASFADCYNPLFPSCPCELATLTARRRKYCARLWRRCPSPKQDSKAGVSSIRERNTCRPFDAAVANISPTGQTRNGESSRAGTLSYLGRHSFVCTFRSARQLCRFHATTTSHVRKTHIAVCSRQLLRRHGSTGAIDLRQGLHQRLIRHSSWWRNISRVREGSCESH